MKVSANNVIKKIIKTMCCIIPIKKYRKILRRNLYNLIYKKYLAIVTKPFSVPNCIIAGIPAKVIKEGVTWDRDNTYYYNKKRFSKKIG